MYVRTVRGATLEFGHRGWLLDESFIFYDRQSDSLWVQATGRCIRGEYQGEELTAVPATHTTWGQWRSMYSDTVVLAKPRALVERYRRDLYHPYYQQRGTKFGLAVFIDSQQKLYPLEQLEATPVVADEVGEEPILVVFHPPSRTAVAFQRIVRPDSPSVEVPDPGRAAEFELSEIAENDVILRDIRTGNLWSGLSGQPISEADSAPLRQIQTTQFVLSNWHKHFPEAPIFGIR